MANEADLEQLVNDQIGATDGLRGTTVTPTVEDGVVTLSGHVDLFEQRQLAIDVASAVDGITQVIDKIKRPGVGCDPATEKPCCGSCIPINDRCDPCAGDPGGNG